MLKIQTTIFFLISLTCQKSYIIYSTSNKELSGLAKENDIKISINWKLNKIKLNFCNEKSTKFLNDNLNVVFVERIVSTHFSCFEEWESLAEEFLDDFFYGFLNFGNFAFSGVSFFANNEGGFLVLKLI